MRWEHGRFIGSSISIRRGADSYTDLEEYVKVPEAPKDDTEEMPVPSESGETGSARWWPEVDFKALLEINPDLVGWIYIEGTGINYPVVQGADNQYYLKHLFTGEWNSSGCIFLDARNNIDLSDRNSILYGHHMKDGSMFHGLMEYKSQEYYDEHPTALFLTLEANYEVKIFSGYVASVDADAWTVGFSSDSEFEEWLRELKNTPVLQARLFLQSQIGSLRCPPAVMNSIMRGLCCLE